MRNLERTVPVRELTEFAAQHSRDGVLVSVRCFAVAEPKPHFEIALEGMTERAVVDVPASQQASLSRRIEDGVSAFVASLRIRSGAYP
jgi:hypothetical protein